MPVEFFHGELLNILEEIRLILGNGFRRRVFLKNEMDAEHHNTKKLPAPICSNSGAFA